MLKGEVDYVRKVVCCKCSGCMCVVFVFINGDYFYFDVGCCFVICGYLLLMFKVCRLCFCCLNVDFLCDCSVYRCNKCQVGNGFG